MSITSVDIAREIRKLSEEQPDRTAQCHYVIDDKPVCIVGQAVYNLMPEKYDAINLLYSAVGETYYSLAERLSRFQGSPVYTIDAVNRWNRHAQAVQDRGETWRYAVAEADLHYPEIFRLTDPLINA